ncbi:hypothetical protein H0H92_000835 [Tricholoma furcatifolium]|nr:hypothetical protein H0H92_000835 [Tricholoma furcatifolium]
MGEDQLIDVFKSVGQVVGFRIDLADSDPFLEGKTTVRGELIDGGTPGPSEPRGGWRGGGGGGRSHESNSILANLPPGIQLPPGVSALDRISQILAATDINKITEVLAQMKASKKSFLAHPQLAYAVFQALVMNNIVDPSILQRMLAATTSGTAQPMTAARPPMPPPHVPPQQPPQYPSMPPQAYPPPPMPGFAPPPAASMYAHQPHMPPHASMPPPAMPAYSYHPPPPPAQPMVHQAPSPALQVSPPAAAPAPPAISDEQRSMIMQVFSLTQEQINAFPEAERSAIQQLRSQYSHLMHGVGA